MMLLNSYTLLRIFAGTIYSLFANLFAYHRIAFIFFLASESENCSVEPPTGTLKNYMIICVNMLS